MDRFVSSFRAKLDAKGRVSVPAPFRAILAREGVEAITIHPSLDQPALDAGGTAMVREIEALLSRYEPYSEAWEVFSMALNGASEQLKLDPEGRMSLSETLKRAAGIAEELVFVGLGHKFQIWEPTAFAAQLSTARESVRAYRRALGARQPESGVSAGARER
jgi:MraZ protein